MRIGIDARIFGLSEAGLGRYARELVEQLLKLDQKNHYVLFLREGGKKQLTEKQLDNLTVEETDISHYSFKEQVLWPSFLSRSRCDLVHFLHFNVPLFYRRPYVVTIHDLIKHESRGLETTTRTPFVYWFKFLAYLLVIVWTARQAKRVIVPSWWVKKNVVRRLRVNPRKVKVVYQGVSQKFLIKGKLVSDKKGDRTKETLKKYQVRKPYLLYVGSVYPHKNLDRLIKAVKQVNQSLVANHKPEVSLVVVCGRNVFWGRLGTKIKRLEAEKIVRLTGFVSEEDLPVFYQEAEAFVFPSFSEGFGLPGLEAMASGCPLICSKIPVFREVYNQVPFYFDPFKVDDLTQKVLMVLGLSEVERRKRIAEGVKRAKEFSWEKCARETLKVYQEVGKEIKGT